MNTTTGTNGHVRAETILQRSVCLTLRCHRLGNDRKLPLDDLIEAVGGDEGALTDVQVRATRKLIDQGELQPVCRPMGRAKQYLVSRAIPTPRVFGETSYLLPLAAVEEVDSRLAGFQQEIQVEAQLLAGRYAEAVARQRAAQGPLFVERDYKTPDEVARAFAIEWEYVSFAAPERLETVSRALFERTRQRYEARMAEAYNETRLVLRATLRELAAKIAEKLTPSADGRPKVFRSTVLDGLTDFLESFRMRDITDDAELGAVVERLRRLTSGLTPDDLRSMETVRATVLGELEPAVAALDGLVTTCRRAISLGPLVA